MNEKKQVLNDNLTKLTSELFPPELISEPTHNMTLNSLEVAEMVEKDHYHLMRNIRNWSTTLTSEIISPGDFWNESTYLDANNQSRPCYLITKKGCEFIAHKTTGKKGAIFTARYINRFHDMEKRLSSVPTTATPTTSIQDNRLEIAKLMTKAKDFKVADLKQLYPEYFHDIIQEPQDTLEQICNINTAYMKWIEDNNITKKWIGNFPTNDIYNHYARYCTENKYMPMGKKEFYRVLENDYNVVKKQKSNGYRYFIGA